MYYERLIKMKIKKEVYAGTDSKEDAYVTLSPSEDGISIEVTSPCKVLFGKAIEEAAKELLKEYGIENCKIHIYDNNALDYTVRARIEAAIVKGIGD